MYNSIILPTVVTYGNNRRVSVSVCAKCCVCDGHLYDEPCDCF